MDYNEGYPHWWTPSDRPLIRKKPWWRVASSSRGKPRTCNAGVRNPRRRDVTSFRPLGLEEMEDLHGDQSKNRANLCQEWGFIWIDCAWSWFVGDLWWFIMIDPIMDEVLETVWLMMTYWRRWLIVFWHVFTPGWMNKNMTKLRIFGGAKFSEASGIARFDPWSRKVEKRCGKTPRGVFPWKMISKSFPTSILVG